MYTATFLLQKAGLKVEKEGVAVKVDDIDAPTLRQLLDQLIADGMPNPTELAEVLENKESDKWDWALDDELLSEAAGARMLDVPGGFELLKSVAPHL